MVRWNCSVCGAGCECTDEEWAENDDEARAEYRKKFPGHPPPAADAPRLCDPCWERFNAWFAATMN